MKTLLLIDGDIVAYQAAVIAQRSGSWDEDEHAVWGYLDKASALDYVYSYIERAEETLDAYHTILTFSHQDNFRKQVYPDYKANRGFSCRPIGLNELKHYLSERFETFVFPQCEADDVLGVLATDPAFRPDEHKIIVSEDKDLKTIPGHLYNPGKGEEHRISPEQADFNFLAQTLAGDVTDGYPGLPGYGTKKAEALLNRHGATWQTVMDAYEQAGYSEAYALSMARCARILRHTDWDKDKQEVKLWTP